MTFSDDFLDTFDDYWPAPTAAPAAGLRWWVTNSRTGGIVGRLNVNSYDITEEIRASSVGNLTVPLPDNSAAVERLRNLIKPAGRRPHYRAVAMEDAATGQILFYGPISAPPRREGPNVALSTVDWSAWFRSALLKPSGQTPLFGTKSDYVVTSREQCLIMWELFGRALAVGVTGKGRPQMIRDDYPTSGVNRDRTARMFSTVGEHLDEISNMDRGAEWFTYGERSSGTSVEAHVAVAWPERGRGGAPIRLSWRQDGAGNTSGTIDSFNWPPGEDNSPTRVFATDGNEDAALWGYSQAITVSDASDSDIAWDAKIDLADGTTDKATATARAKGELNRATQFDGLLEVTVAAERLAFSSLVVGDRARVEIDDGWNRTVNTNSSRIVRRVMAGGAGKPTTQTLTVDLDDNRYPFTGQYPGVAVSA
jgi:hypothetical protein